MDPGPTRDTASPERPRLSTFIRARRREILEEWERAVRQQPGVRELERPALLDQIPELLERLAVMTDELAAGQSPQTPAALAEEHALARLDEGIDLAQVVTEYAALRDGIVRLWSAEPEAGAHDPADVRSLHQAIDRAVVVSVQRYTQARDRRRQVLDRVSAAALETRSLDDFLGRLLRVLVEATAAVDTATILLLDGDLLRVRASIGLADAAAAGVALRVGEGFAGLIAKTGQPHAVPSAATDPLVLDPAVRAAGVKALYGVPLIEGGEVIGVAHMGSVTAPSFSTQDQRLFAAIAHRATFAIRLHLLREAADLRARQQQTIAALGVRALSPGDLDALLALVIEGVRDTLAVELADILELDPSATLVVRAEAGWGPEVVGGRRVARSERSQAWFTIRTGQPVIIDDLATEARFVFPDLFRERGIRSGISVPIRLPGEAAPIYGVLGVHTTRRRAFRPDDVAFLQAIGHVVGTAVALRRAERARAEVLAQERSARAEAERMLAVLDAILSASSVGLAIVDTELRYVRVNDALAEINGLPAAEHVGRTMREVLGELAIDTLDPMFRRILETRAPVRGIEFEVALPPGSTAPRSFLASYVPVVTPRGEVLGVGAVVIDVTEQRRADAALRFNEALLQSILDHAPAAIYVKDAGGRVLLVNRLGAAMSGRRPEELLGRTEYDLFPAVADRVRASDLEVLGAGQAIELEETYELPGGPRTFLTAKFPLPGPGGERYLSVISADITERKRMELELRERERWLRLLADNIPQLAWMADEIGTIFWFNRRWYEVTGMPLERALELAWRIVHPEHTARVAENYRRRIGSGEVWEDTFPMLTADGRYRWFLSRAVPVRDEQGRVVRWFGTNTDVTEQRFMHEATTLLSSSLDYRATLERVAQLAVPALGDWCGIDLVEGRGITRVAIAHHDPAKVELAHQLAHQYPPDQDAPLGVPGVIRTGVTEYVPEITDELLATWTCDPEYVRIARALGLRSYVIAPVVARDRTLGAITLVGAESGRLYTPADITVIEELGRRIGLAVDNARLLEAAQHEARMREELLAVVSHDLKSPLGAILLAAALLLETAEPRIRRQLETIHRAASRMEHLIGDLLDLASIQAGRLSIERKPEDVDTLVREALESNLSMARDKGVTLARDCELGDALILADRDRILQVFGNLIGNAIKFCRPGDTIAIRGERRGADVELTVADTGPGIPEADLPHVFEPYWSARKYAKKGTGLGLYISKGIVEAHGGRIWVESLPGVGTSIHFTIPLV